MLMPMPAVQALHDAASDMGISHCGHVFACRFAFLMLTSTEAGTGTETGTETATLTGTAIGA